MQIETDKLNQAIDKAHEIQEIYNLHYLDSNNPIRALDNLVDLCERYLHKTVLVREHNMRYTGQPINGFFLAFNDGHYEIVILSGLNYCWQRMVLCKELFHVFLDNEERHSKSIKDLIDETTITLRVDKHALPNDPMQWELAAEIAAVEFLFPYKKREIVLSSCGTTPDYLKIAEQYKIPRIIVEQYISPSNMSALKAFSIKN